MGRSSKKKQNKLMMQIVSVLIAVALWIIVGYTEDPNIDVNINDVQVEYTGLAKLENRGLTVSRADRPPEISMAVRGRRSDLLQVLGKVKASVDVSSLTDEGTYTLDIKINMPVSTVQVIKQRMTSADVVIEPLVTKDIPVAVKQINTEKNKEYLVKSVPEHETIEVTGAKSLIEKIARAEITADISDIHADSTQKYNYRLIDQSNSELGAKQLLRTDAPDLFVQHIVYTPKTVAVKTALPQTVADAYAVQIKSISPANVSVGVRGDTGPDEVTAWFAEGTYETGIKEYSLNLEELDGMYIPAEEKLIKVKAEVQKKTQRTLTVPIQIVNAPEGTVPVPEKNMIDVLVTMPENQASEGSLTATVDLAGIQGGTHEMPVLFWTADNVTVQGTYKLKITV